MPTPILHADSDIIAALRARIKAEGSQAAAARSLGYSPQFIADVLLGRRRVSNKFAEALGFRRLDVWVKTEEAG